VLAELMRCSFAAAESDFQRSPQADAPSTG
jgi:hypothetical protein